MFRRALGGLAASLAVAFAAGCSERAPQVLSARDTAPKALVAMAEASSSAESTAAQTHAGARKVGVRSAVSATPSRSAVSTRPALSAARAGTPAPIEKVEVRASPTPFVRVMAAETVAPLRDSAVIPQSERAAPAQSVSTTATPTLSAELGDASSSALSAVASSSSSAAVAAAVIVPTVTPGPSPTPRAYIRGHMRVDFGSRVKEGGIDNYTIDIACGDNTKITGSIARHPRRLSAILGREQEALHYEYALAFTVKNPADRSESKRVGVWNGSLSVARDGRYDPASLTLKALLPNAPGATSGNFGGLIRGKAEESQVSIKSIYTRLFGGKRVTIAAQRVDPLRFERLKLAPGPLEMYPASEVNGNLDYDYDTGNWLTNGVTFKSAEKSVDTLSGSIRWIEDPERARNGRGKYEFNLRLNEERLQKAADEGAFFESVSDEESFFQIDAGLPRLTGTISYVDTFGPGSDSTSEPLVVHSEIDYDLVGEGFSSELMMNFLKFWLLIVGPVNDE